MGITLETISLDGLVLLALHQTHLSEFRGQHTDLVLLNEIFVGFGLHSAESTGIAPQLSLF